MSLKINLVKCVHQSVKNTRQCTISISAGPMGKLYILFKYNNYLLFFQFVVTGGIGCLSYKHPKKITVSILCTKQTELASCFQFQTHINF